MTSSGQTLKLPKHPQREYEIPQGSGHVVWRALTPPANVSFLGNNFLSVKKALETAFGAYPFELGVKDLPVLRAMAAAAGEGKTPYEDLVAALEKHDGLSVNLSGAR